MSSYAIVQRGNFALLPCVLNCQQVSIGVVVTLTCATSPAKPSVHEVHERNAMMSWGVTSPLIVNTGWVVCGGPLLDVVVQLN